MSKEPTDKASSTKSASQTSETSSASAPTLSSPISSQSTNLAQLTGALLPPTAAETDDARKPSASGIPRAEESEDTKARQVIAVSASKGPAAFFNLARKFLVTDDVCDLSALEGAIVSAVDAAHLLERSKLATIVRIQTSYVRVEPKRRKQTQATTPPATTAPSDAAETISGYGGSTARRTSTGRELRRARIVITVRRTENYQRWLEENPLQAMIASEAEDDTMDDVHVSSKES